MEAKIPVLLLKKLYLYVILEIYNLRNLQFEKFTIIVNLDHYHAGEVNNKVTASLKLIFFSAKKKQDVPTKPEQPIFVCITS